MYLLVGLSGKTFKSVSFSVVETSDPPNDALSLPVDGFIAKNVLRTRVERKENLQKIDFELVFCMQSVLFSLGEKGES